VAFGPVSKQRHRVAVPTHCEVGGGFVWAPQGYVSPPSAAMSLLHLRSQKHQSTTCAHCPRGRDDGGGSVHVVVRRKCASSPSVVRRHFRRVVEVHVGIQV